MKFASSLRIWSGVTQAPLILVFVFALATWSACQPPSNPTPKPAAPASPVQVQTKLPHRGEIARTITLPTSRTLPIQEATLYAKVSGYLKTLSVDKGDRVHAGQILGEIELPELLADEAQFRAESKVAQTNYERMAVARTKAPDLVVPQTIDDLQGQWQIAQAKLDRTRALLEYSKIAAPFSGVVTARFVDPGAFIPAATAGSNPQSAAIVTVMDASRVRIQIHVPELEVRFVRNGLPAKISVEALPGKIFEGTVTRFAYALNPTTKTMLTEIELPNPNDELRPGVYASVQLELERKKDALLIPTRGLQVEKAGSVVFLVSDGKAKRTPVQTGFNDGVNVEITSGISPEQSVVLLGKQTLTDGQPVSATEEK